MNVFSPEHAAKTEPEWNQFRKVYDATFAHITAPPTRELFTKWVDRVERFTF
jgi:hypothetical protein